MPSKQSSFQQKSPPQQSSRTSFTQPALPQQQKPAERAQQQHAGLGNLRKGVRVRHEMFGIGTVMAIGGSGDMARVEVSFSGVGRKSLLIKFAKLTVLD